MGLDLKANLVMMLQENVFADITLKENNVIDANRVSLGFLTAKVIC